MTRMEVKRIVDSITKQLIDKYHPDKVILFGSASRDDEDVHDIDLFYAQLCSTLSGHCGEK